MVTEYWGTFSIYDHREPFYKPSLVLFDSIVMPVPTSKFRSIDAAELRQLRADAEYLAEKGCAHIFFWNSKEFDEWRSDFVGASAASRISIEREAGERDHADYDAQIAQRDARLDTRYQMQYEVKAGRLRPPATSGRDVIAMPVFGARPGYSNLPPEEILGVDSSRQATVDLVIKQLPVPAPDTPLESIVALREDGGIMPAVQKLRQWQIGLMSDLSAIENDLNAWTMRLERAEVDLRVAIGDYKRAMANLHDASVTRWLTTLFSVLTNPLTALGRLFAEHRDDFTIQSEHERSWKALYDKPFAFAGAIVALENELG
jgi:hypothetical protein